MRNNMKKQRALITGMAGMVGSHLCDYLLENTDWDIIGFLRWNDPMDNLSHIFYRINDEDRVFLDFGDLNDQTSIQLCLEKYQPDFIFHLAAQ